MKEITYEEYTDSKRAFYGKHDTERGHCTSSDVQGTTIFREVTFDDGAWWYEVTEPVTEMVEVALHGIVVQTPIRMYRTEIFDSENTKSRYLFAKAV